MGSRFRGNDGLAAFIPLELEPFLLWPVPFAVDWQSSEGSHQGCPYQFTAGWEEFLPACFQPRGIGRGGRYCCGPQT